MSYQFEPHFCRPQLVKFKRGTVIAYMLISFLLPIGVGLSYEYYIEKRIAEGVSEGVFYDVLGDDKELEFDQ